MEKIPATPDEAAIIEEVPVELIEFWNSMPEVIKLGDPILRKIAKPVTRINRDIQNLVKRMEKIMRDSDGLGLAAPQIGESIRLFVYDSGEGFRVIINPQIVSLKGEQSKPNEGCLSIPGLQGVVKRAKEVRVRGFDERNKPINRRATELEARVIQHELDHLDGVLFFDRVEQGTLEWVIGEDDDEQQPQG